MVLEVVDHERLAGQQAEGREPDPGSGDDHDDGRGCAQGVGKHTIYRRWPSKGPLFLDAVLYLNAPALKYRDTGDVVADLRSQVHAAIDLLGRPPFGPLYQALLGEAQHDSAIAAAVNERFITPQTQRTVARLEAARDQGRYRQTSI